MEGDLVVGNSFLIVVVYFN